MSVFEWARGLNLGGMGTLAVKDAGGIRMGLEANELNTVLGPQAEGLYLNGPARQDI